MPVALPSAFLPAPRRVRLRLAWLLPAALAGVLWTCQFTAPTDLEQRQAANLRLTKALHAHLNQGDWAAVGKLCAPIVRYRGQLTHFADIDEPRAHFLTRYRSTLSADGPDALEIRQVYPAGGYHVIVEGRVGQPPEESRLVCLIYTIEEGHVTRLYAY